jgi:capsule polysaccharide modification protein KpsS
MEKHTAEAERGAKKGEIRTPIFQAGYWRAETGLKRS